MRKGCISDKGCSTVEKHQSTSLKLSYLSIPNFHNFHPLQFLIFKIENYKFANHSRITRVRLFAVILLFLYESHNLRNHEQAVPTGLCWCDQLF